MAAITALLTASIAETVFEAQFGTYTRAAAGFTATPKGIALHVHVAMTLLVAVSITETEWLSAFVVSEGCGDHCRAHPSSLGTALG